MFAKIVFSGPTGAADNAASRALDRLANVTFRFDGNPSTVLRISTLYSGLGVAGVLLGSSGGLMYSAGSSPVSVFRKATIDLASAALSRLPVW